MNICKLIRKMVETCNFISQPSLPENYKDILTDFSNGTVRYLIQSGDGSFSGYLNVYFSEAGAALLVADFHVIKEFTVALEDDSDCFYVSYYITLNADYLTGGKRYKVSAERAYTSAGVTAPSCTVFHADSDVKGVILVISPSEYLNHFRTYNDLDVESLEYCFSHFGQINDYHYIPALDEIYLQLRRFEGKKLFEKMFLESKVHEIVSLLSHQLDMLLSTEKIESTLNQEDMEGIRRVRDYISEHLSEDPGNEELAAVAHMSQAKLKYTFKAITGVTIREYRKGLRLTRAKELLKTTTLSCSEIADRLGFGSLAAFSSFFVRQVGTTPAVWRKRDGS